jgi:heme/copper-type cytochrome/quinol oxidase subunit 2
MRYVLVVDEQEEYDKWVAQQQPWAEANRDYVLANLPDNLKDKLPSLNKTAPEEVPVNTVPADTTKAPVSLNSK